MSYWVLHLWCIGFGTIWIAGGVAFQSVDFWMARWLCICLGLMFTGLGASGLIGGQPLAKITFAESDRRGLFALGCCMSFFGGLGATYVAIAYPFSIPEWAGQAWWIGWVFFAGLLWFATAGVGFLLLARTSN